MLIVFSKYASLYFQRTSQFYYIVIDCNYNASIFTHINRVVSFKRM